MLANIKQADINCPKCGKRAKYRRERWQCRECGERGEVEDIVGERPQRNFWETMMVQNRGVIQ